MPPFRQLCLFFAQKYIRISMKRNNQLLTVFILMIVISALYRALPFESRPVWLGGPQLAMALFAGSIIRNRKWAFALPIFSMLLSDALMQILYVSGQSPYPGFYGGQLLNYVFISSLVVVGFFVNKTRLASILTGVVAAPTLFFLLSNFSVWVSGRGYHRAKTFAGLIQCYADGLPFYGYSLMTMAVFSTALFGAYHLLETSKAARSTTA